MSEYLQFRVSKDIFGADLVMDYASLSNSLFMVKRFNSLDNLVVKAIRKESKDDKVVSELTSGGYLVNLSNKEAVEDIQRIASHYDSAFKKVLEEGILTDYIFVISHTYYTGSLDRLSAIVQDAVPLYYNAMKATLAGLNENDKTVTIIVYDNLRSGSILDDTYEGHDEMFASVLLEYGKKLGDSLYMLNYR